MHNSSGSLTDRTNATGHQKEQLGNIVIRVEFGLHLYLCKVLLELRTGRMTLSIQRTVLVVCCYSISRNEIELESVS